METETTIPYWTPTQLQDHLAQTTQPTLVVYTANWCQPCKAQTPALTTLANNNPNTLTVAKIDIEQHPQHTQQANIMSIPTHHWHTPNNPTPHTTTGTQTTTQLQHTHNTQP